MNNSLQRQRGAVLIVALVMLLVITLLAVSSTRESALETRMTANFVSQQQQQNYAEAVLREGEEQMTFATKVARDVNADNNNTCADDDRYCFIKNKTAYTHLFGDCDDAITVGVGTTLLAADAYDGTTLEPPGLRWYALEAAEGGGASATKNPEYGNRVSKSAQIERFYEISAVAQDGNNDICTILRSTVSKQF